MSQPVGSPFPDPAHGSDSVSVGVNIDVSDAGSGADGMGGLQSQFLRMIGNPTSGTFTLSLPLIEGTETTVPLPWNVDAGTQATNDVQTIVMTATGGSFTISNGSSATPDMPWDVSPLRMGILIQNLVGVGYNNVHVTGVAGIKYVIEGSGTLFDTFIPTFALRVTGLTGGAASLTHTVVGGGASLTLVKALQALPLLSDVCKVFAQGVPGVEYTISFKTIVPQITVSTPYAGQPFLVNFAPGDDDQSVKILIGPDVASTTVWTMRIYVPSPNVTYTIGPFAFNVSPKDLKTAIVASGALNSLMAFDVSWDKPIPANDVQTISISVTSGPTGTFTITCDQNGQANTTPAMIPGVVTAAQMQANLEALINIGAGNVTVNRKNDGDFEVTFVNQLAFKTMNKLIVNKSYFGVGSVAHTVVGTPYPAEGPEITYTLDFQVHVPLFIATSSFNGYVPITPNAIDFAGNSLSYALASDAGLPTGASERTISFWLLIQNALSPPIPCFATLLCYSGLPEAGPNHATYIGVLNNVGSMQFCVSENSTAFYGGSALVVGQKYFVTLTYDGSVYRLYANSVLIAAKVLAINTLTGWGLFFGTDPARPSWHRYIDGAMQDIRIYNRKLTDAEIVTVYNGGNQILTDGVTSGLVRWYKTTEGSGNTTDDAISHYAATLNNAGWLYAGGGGGGSLPTATAITGYNSVIAELGAQAESGLAAEAMTENVTINLSDSGKGEEYTIGSPARVAYPDVPFITGQR